MSEIIKEPYIVLAGGRIRCRRCQALSVRSKEQCKKPAMTGKRVCDYHGGRSTGPRTEEGKARVAKAHTIHGNETKVKRQKRSESSAYMMELEDVAWALDPLSDGVLALLDTIPRFAYCKYVFPNPSTLKPYQNIYRTWHRARTDAGIEDVRIHDLRHNFASLLVNHGRSLYEVQQILGHSQVRTTQRYAHLANETLVAAANVASSAVDGFTSKENSIDEEEQEGALVQQSLISTAKQEPFSAIKPSTFSAWVMLA